MQYLITFDLVGMYVTYRPLKVSYRFDVDLAGRFDIAQSRVY